MSPSPSGSPSPGDQEGHLGKLRSQIFATNTQLDGEAASEQSSTDLPTLLRRSDNVRATGLSADMVNFAKTDWQSLINWRDCAAHTARLSVMDLNEPRKAFLDIMATLGQARDHGMNIVGRKQSPQSTDSNLLQPHSQARSSPQNVADSHLRFSTPSSPADRQSSNSQSSSTPYTPEALPKPGAAQHLAKSREVLLDGHMPRLFGERAEEAIAQHKLALSWVQAARTQHNGNLPSSVGNRQYRSPYLEVLSGPQGPGRASEGLNQNGRNEVVPSQTGQLPPQPLQKPHQDAANISPHSSSLASYRPNTNLKMSGFSGSPPPMRQPHNGNVDPYGEFAAELDRRRNENRPDNFAGEEEGQLKRKLPGNGGDNAGNSNPAVANNPDPARIRNNNGLTKPFYPKARPLPVVQKTPEQIEHELAVAQWNQWQKEHAMKLQKERERKERIKKELEVEMKIPGNDILAYRYHDYMEMHPRKSGERLSAYHTGLLANQKLEDRDRSESAMAIRYAKEKWWNYWTVKDKQMVIDILRKKKQSGGDKTKEEMKAGGHLVTGADIDQFRKAATFTVPGGSATVDGDVFENLEASEL